MKMREQAVVVPFSTTETMALRSEGHAGNDGKVYMFIVGEEGTDRLLNAKGSAHREFLFALIAVQFQFFSSHRGKKYIFSLGMKMADEVVSADFIGQGMIEEDGVEAILLCYSVKQCVSDTLTVPL